MVQTIDRGVALWRLAGHGPSISVCSCGMRWGPALHRKFPTGDPALAKSISDDLIAIARGVSPPHGSASGKVARRLGVDILRGHLKRGDKLPSEQGLLARFGVLRTVLREAVKILSANGFLQAKTRVGTAVRDRENWNFFDAEVLAWRISAGLDADLLQTLREA